MEDKEDGLRVSRLELLLDKGLVFAKELRVELHVTRLVHAVNVSKSSGNCEEIRDFRELSVNVPNILWLGVEGGIVNVLIVHAVFLTASNANFHFKEKAHWCHSLEIALANLNVLGLGLFGEIEHVRREERLSMNFKVVLIGLDHAVEPGEKALGTVIRVEHNGNAIRLCNITRVVGTYFTHVLEWLP